MILVNSCHPDTYGKYPHANYVDYNIDPTQTEMDKVKGFSQYGNKLSTRPVNQNKQVNSASNSSRFSQPRANQQRPQQGNLYNQRPNSDINVKPITNQQRPQLGNLYNQRPNSNINAKPITNQQRPQQGNLYNQRPNPNINTQPRINQQRQQQTLYNKVQSHRYNQAKASDIMTRQNINQVRQPPKNISNQPRNFNSNIAQAESKHQFSNLNNKHNRNRKTPEQNLNRASYANSNFHNKARTLPRASGYNAADYFPEITKSTHPYYKKPKKDNSLIISNKTRERFNLINNDFFSPNNPNSNVKIPSFFNHNNEIEQKFFEDNLNLQKRLYNEQEKSENFIPKF